MPIESTYVVSHASRSVHQAEEDHFSSTKDKVNRPESSRPVRPTTKVYSRNKPGENYQSILTSKEFATIGSLLKFGLMFIVLSSLFCFYFELSPRPKRRDVL